MNSPYFSIVIPLYNKEEYIEKCIKSVLDQSFTSFEIIVIDDGSTDNSSNFVKNFENDKIRYFKQENSGVSAARNNGIKLSKGQYVSFLDADDWYEKECLSTIYLLSKNYSHADAIVSAYYKHINGKITKSFIPNDFARINNGGVLIEDFYNIWSDGAFFYTSSCAIKRSYFQLHKKYFPELENMGEDQEMWFHLAENGKIIYTKLLLSNYNMATTNSLSYHTKIIQELPFITRLKNRIKKADFKYKKSAKKMIAVYELELAINNAIYGKKIDALNLLIKNIFSKKHKLKVICFLLIILPKSIFRKIKNKSNAQN